MVKNDEVKTYLKALLVVLVLGLIGLSTLVWIRGSREGGIDPEIRREVASRLLGVGLGGEAARQYEIYLNEAGIDSEARAKIAFSIGKAYQDQGNLGRALSWYYQAEVLDPHSPIKSELGSRIVECLEKLGKYQSAQYALKSRAGLEKEGEGEKKGGKVIARIGDRAITLSEFDEALDRMPEWIRSQYQDPAKKAEFLQRYVVNELLFEKAKKLGYDRDPEIRKEMDLFEKQLLVNRMLAEEVQEKVQVADSDIELYYRANQDRYIERASARVSLIKLASREEAEEVRKDLMRGRDFSALAREKSLDEATRDKGGEVTYPIRQGEDNLGLGNEAGLWKLIKGTPVGGVTPVLQAGDSFYLFQIHEKRPERQRSLDEVRELVHQDLTRERINEKYGDLVKTMLAAAEVELFPEVLKEEQ